MAKREVRAKEVMKDIGAGMNDAALMKKYKLSRQGLKSLFKELADIGLLEKDENPNVDRPRRRISIRQIVADIRSGYTDTELQKKYKVSCQALQIIFKKLLDLHAVSRDQLFGEVMESCEPGAVVYIREVDRCYLDFEIPVYEVGSPEYQGSLRDITEKGVGLAGIEAMTGEVKKLVVLGDAYGVVNSFEFEAECRWAQREQFSGTLLSGHRILSIADPDLEELRKLIRLVTLEE